MNKHLCWTSLAKNITAERYNYDKLSLRFNLESLIGYLCSSLSLIMLCFLAPHFVHFVIAAAAMQLNR